MFVCINNNIIIAAAAANRQQANYGSLVVLLLPFLILSCSPSRIGIQTDANAAGGAAATVDCVEFYLFDYLASIYL